MQRGGERVPEGRGGEGREDRAVRKGLWLQVRRGPLSWDERLWLSHSSRGSYFSLQMCKLAVWFLKPYIFHLHLKMKMYFICYLTYLLVLGMGPFGGWGEV